MRIIPAIDVIDGKCVRLTQGDYGQKKTYNEDPLEVAKLFEGSGLQYLHLVDLDGAKAGKVVNWKLIERLTSQTSLAIDFGGGIKTEEEIELIFKAGIAQVNLGSIAVNRPYKVHDWVQKFGAEKIIVSADVRGEHVAINGWQETTKVDLINFVRGFEIQGLRFVACTDIDRDGMLNGPNLQIYQKLKNEFSTMNVIASGGVSKLHDLITLKQTGVDGVIIGKAIYENRITLKELSEFK